MCNKIEELTKEYTKYLADKAEYEKALYAYESRISEYGSEVKDLIIALKELGIELDVTSIDLADSNQVQQLLCKVTKVYTELMDRGMSLLKG